MKIGESKISQRGSVVIPKAIREALKVEDGEYVEWHIQGGFKIDDVPYNQNVVVKKKVSK